MLAHRRSSRICMVTLLKRVDCIQECSSMYSKWEAIREANLGTQVRFILDWTGPQGSEKVFLQGTTVHVNSGPASAIPSSVRSCRSRRISDSGTIVIWVDSGCPHGPWKPTLPFPPFPPSYKPPPWPASARGVWDNLVVVVTCWEEACAIKFRN